LGGGGEVVEKGVGVGGCGEGGFVMGVEERVARAMLVILMNRARIRPHLGKGLMAGIMSDMMSKGMAGLK
jgi:hypothetical protein